MGSPLCSKPGDCEPKTGDGTGQGPCHDPSGLQAQREQGKGKDPMGEENDAFPSLLGPPWGLKSREACGEQTKTFFRGDC